LGGSVFNVIATKRAVAIDQPTPFAEIAVCDVECGVDVRLVLLGLTGVVGAVERRLRGFSLSGRMTLADRLTGYFTATDTGF